MRPDEVDSKAVPPLHHVLDYPSSVPRGVAAPPEAYRAEAVLSTLSQVAVGVAGCGTDTGRITAVPPGSRHARPAVAAPRLPVT